MKPHSVSAFSAFDDDTSVSSIGNVIGMSGSRRIAGMDVPDRIAELLLAVLPLVAVEELLILVDVARDHVEIQPLRRLRLAIHEQRQDSGEA